MNMRDQWRMAFSAARLATCVDTHGDGAFVARIPSKALRDAVNYAATPFTDPLRFRKNYYLRIQNDKRYYAANPHMRPGGFNCRCVALPINAQPPAPEPVTPPRS